MTDRSNVLRNAWIVAVIVGMLLAFPLFLTGCGSDEEGGSGGILSDPEPKEPEIVELTIACVGDVMCHKQQLEGGRRSDGTYDFSEYFQYVTPYIEYADLALCNVETTFAGAPYSGYPAFSSPEILAKNLKDAGFDVAITSNNHMVDRGTNGLIATLDVLRKEGFQTTGSRFPEEVRFCMNDVKGLKVATVAYTYQTPDQGGGCYINGTFMDEDKRSRINSFGYENVDETVAKIGQTIQEARNSGADIVVLYMHWGEEYQLASNQWQQLLAERLTAETSCDMIFGSHPHNLQETAVVNSKPVFYSLGNFVSNQRTETLGAGYKATETGCIAYITVTYNVDEKQVVGTYMSAVPTWVDKYQSGGLHYSIIPLDDTVDSNPTLAASGHLSRAKGALEDARNLLKLYQ